jgi:predicted RNA-binding protein with PIN domain
MPLFIDCYNLLHATMPPSLAGLDEDGLCRVLAASPWRGDRIVVVCDGMVKPGTPSASPVASVELIYSGSSKSADDVIMEMTAANSAPRRLYVVTDDREIQKAVKRRKAQVIGTSAFIRALASSRPEGSRIDSTTRHRPTLPEGEVNQWLKEFGIDPNAPAESVAQEKEADPRRAPLEREPVATPDEAQKSLDDDEVAKWLKEFGVAPDEPIDPRKREWWES